MEEGSETVVPGINVGMGYSDGTHSGNRKNNWFSCNVVDGKWRSPFVPGQAGPVRVLRMLPEGKDKGERENGVPWYFKKETPACLGVPGLEKWTG